MYSLAFLIVISLLLSLGLTPLCKKIAWKFGVVDIPDKRRKLHIGPIPRLGGVAIFAAMLGAYCLLLMMRLSSGHIIWKDLPLIMRILPALTLVFLVGILDDLFNLRPWVKLSVETAAAVTAWIAGIHVSGVVKHEFSSVIGFLITIAWIIGCTNAINLIDGVDGLAAGASLFAAITMSVSALIDKNYPMALVVVPLVGALLGFLRYNFDPATIFLGDCGSLSLGFLLACCGAVWSEKATTAIGLTAPLLALAVPILDTSLAIARRFIANQSVFCADHEHIHHKLLSKGLTPRHAVLILYAICAAATTASLLLAARHNHYRGGVIVVTTIAICAGIQYLGYREFNVFRRAILRGTFREVLSSQIQMDCFEVDIEQETTLEGCSEILCRNYSRFGFTGISLNLNGVLHRRGNGNGWQARIEFMDRGHITLWRDAAAEDHVLSSTRFVDTVSRIISQKLEREVNSCRLKHTNASSKPTNVA